ncbi:DUF2922 domain-containing protein [Hathewaya massiliensis]|uniref:DUF2922 domain-containing protein n=1 Tax=Hathewaya massiliensis TaxID=1964382 RepID=UPI001156DE59|nr:DUF2922 domain-containing protein [Hathewaya massiliensis]
MAKELVMNFLNEAGTKTALRVKNVKENLTEDDIGIVMDTIVSKDVFKSKNGALKAKHSANIVDRQVEKYEFK